MTASIRVYMTSICSANSIPRGMSCAAMNGAAVLLRALTATVLRSREFDRELGFGELGFGELVETRLPVSYVSGFTR